MGIAEQRAAARRKQIVRSVIVLAAVAACALAALVAAAQLERQRGPQARELLGRVGSAVAGEGHVSFRIQGSAKVEGGEEGGGQVAERLGGGLDLRGYAGPGQLMVSGTVGDGEKVELRMAGKQLAIQQRGRWYAGQVGSWGRPDALFDPVLWQRKLLHWFKERSYGDEKIQGRSTWRLDGKVPSGQQLSAPTPMLNPNTLIKDVSYSLWVERRSSLPVRFKFVLAGKPEDWMMALQSDEGPDAIEIHLQVDFTDWGRSKQVVIPPGTAPLEQLEQDLLPS